MRRFFVKAWKYITTKGKKKGEERKKRMKREE